IGLAAADHGEAVRHGIAHRLEVSRRGIPPQEAAAGDTEIRAVEEELAALDQRAHARERHEVVQAELDRGELEPAQIGLAVVLGARAEPLRGGRYLRHPSADEVARRQRLALVREGPYAAAEGVSENHDVTDAQRLHAE